MIALVRCDDRLIHGQCVLRIIPNYNITDIIVVDDYTATNAMLKKIFMMSAPKGVATVVLTKEEAVEHIKTAMTDATKTLVLMRTPEIMNDLCSSIEGFPKDLNIASLPSTPGKVQISTGIYFNESQMNAVKQMSENGVHVWFQLVPGEAKLEWNDIKSKY